MSKNKIQVPEGKASYGTVQNGSSYEVGVNLKARLQR